MIDMFVLVDAMFAAFVGFGAACCIALACLYWRGNVLEK